MTERRAIAGVLLAAGSARRFGSDKLLAPLADGTPLGVAAAATLAAAVDRLVVVVAPAQAARARSLAGRGAQLVVCPAAHRGMAHSLRCGIGAAADADAWLIALADMPFVGAPTLTRLVAALREGAAIVVPNHGGRDGHPVGFAAHLRGELAGLSGDRGARDVLERHAAAVTRIVVADRGVLRDVDVPADLDAAD